MADNTYNVRTYEKAPDLTGAFSAVRGEQPGFSVAQDPDEDISATQHGSKAVLGKAVWSANNSVRMNDERDEKVKDAEAAERELQEFRMAQWDAAKTNVGGIDMTNAEAQDARRAVIEDGDRYAQWAVENGYLAHGEEEQFKDAARRMYELKEAERKNGQMTEAQKQEWDALEASRAGRAADAATAEAYREHSPRAGMTSQVSSAADKDSPFPSAPQVNIAFTAATAGITSTNDPAPRPNQAPDVPKPQSTSPSF